MPLHEIGLEDLALWRKQDDLFLRGIQDVVVLTARVCFAAAHINRSAEHSVNLFTLRQEALVEWPHLY